MNKRDFLETYLFNVLGQDNWHSPEHIITAAEKAWHRLNPGEIPRKPVDLSTAGQIAIFLRGRTLTVAEADDIIQQVNLCRLAQN